MFWVYIPVRQWAARKLSPQNEVLQVEELIASISKTITNDYSDEAVSKMWANLLEDLYTPSACETIYENESLDLKDISVSDNGLTLVSKVPAYPSLVKISLKFKGRRLFNKSDAKRVLTLHAMALEMIKQQREKEKSMVNERERIAADLHDDLAPQILSLVRATEGKTKEKAKRAFTLLRETVYAMRRDSDSTLTGLMVELNAYFNSIDEQVPTDIIAKIKDIPENIKISPLDEVNIVRIIRELLNNAITHNTLTQLELELWFEPETQDLFCTISHNYSGEEPAHWIKGTGLHSLNKRLSELSGELEYTLASHTLTITVKMPIKYLS